MTLLLGQALTTPIASRKTTAAEGLSPKDTHRREIWTGQEWLPSQLYQSLVGRHIGAWIRSIFLVMNLLVLYGFFIWLRKSVWWSRFSSTRIVNLLLKRLMPFKEERAVELGYSLREGILTV